MKNESNNMITERINDDIDISKILNIFIRNKFLIASFTFLFFIGSCVYSLTKKRIWEGQFQIVLRESKEINTPKGLLSNNANLLEAFDFGGNLESNLKTEVGILQSSSVLMPIFESFKEGSAKLNNNSPKIFSSWKNNLDVSLEKYINVNISFRDNDKKLINLVLER